MTRSVRFAPLALLLLAAGSCRAREARREDEVFSAIQHGRYEAAREEARRLAEANPNDPRTQALLLEAELAVALDQGRTAAFRGDLDLALERFEEARRLAPDHPTVTTWIAKTHAQLAQQWLDRAVEASGPDNLAEARRAYERVLEHDPSNPGARDGLARVLLLENYRAGMSKTYFDDGLASFRRLQLDQARRSFQISREYAENEPAGHRAAQVETMLASERLQQARELEAKGSFFAARNEYRLVLLIDPENAEGRAGLDRMDLETRAARTLDTADMAVRRGEFEKAAEALAEAEVLTRAQTDELQLLQTDIAERRLAERYHEARSLADDRRYPEAVEAFGALLAEAPDYQDAAPRKAMLEEFIRQAEEFYPLAVAATDDEVAEGYLRAIEVVWPEYKDVTERLEALEERRAASKAEAPAADESESAPAAEAPATEPER